MTAIAYTVSYLIVVAAGISLALQQVLNANLRRQLGSPWWAGFVSYFVGMLFMPSVARSSSAPQLPGSLNGATTWLSWTGGIFGAVFIATAIFMVPRLGAASVLALIVVGQMFASLTLDHFGLLGIPRHSANPLRLLGTGLPILGVVLIRM